jgi:putative ABC transport system permease protein
LPVDPKAGIEKGECDPVRWNDGPRTAVSCPSARPAGERSSELIEHRRRRAQAVPAAWPRRDADRWIPGDPIGRRLHIDDDTSASRGAEIVGVVANTRETTLDRSAGPMVYLALEQISRATVPWLANNQFWLVRTPGEPEAFERTFRAALRDVDADAAASRTQRLERFVDELLSSRRFNTALMVLFAAAASLLAAIGLYTVVSYSVRQRTAEIAVRLALGATPARVVKLVAWQGFRPVMAGWLVGVVAMRGTGRLVSNMLFQTTATEPSVVAAATAALLVLAACAAVPARRAAFVEPFAALHSE